MERVVTNNQWLCEPALWLKWTHIGMASAKTACEITTLDSELFQQILQTELPESAIYAKAFLVYARLNEDQLDDVFCDGEALVTMARATFEPPLVFDVARCRPVKNDLMGKDEWNPKTVKAWQGVWQSAWKETHVLDRSALIKTMTTDMKNDSVIMYQTLFVHKFQQFTGYRGFSDEEVLMHERRVVFLKRLLLAFAVCGVGLTSESNGAAVKPWPYPLASVLSHGGRVLLCLKGIPWKDFINFLIFGNPTDWDWDGRGVPLPMVTRKAATHGMKFDASMGHLQELKLNHASAVLQRGHLGMDLPVGGLGNPMPLHENGQLYVGPSGVPFKGKKSGSVRPHLMKDMQHGHMYLRGCEFGTTDMMVPESEDVPDGLSSPGSSDALGDLRRDFTPMQSNFGAKPVSVKSESWHKNTDVRSADELQTLLINSGYSTDIEQVERLWRLVDQSELVLETRERGTHSVSEDPDIRFHGVLLEIAVEYDAPAGESMILVQTGAEAIPDLEKSRPTVSGRSEAPSFGPMQSMYVVGKGAKAAAVAAAFGGSHSDSQSPPGSRASTIQSTQSARMEDRTLLTILCCHHEPWANAVLRHLQDVFLLSEEAAKEILKGCQTGKDTCIYESGYAPTVCHHHYDAVGSTIPLEYNTLHLRMKIDDPESPLFMPLFANTLATQEPACIYGFGGLAQRSGTISREWAWLSTDAAVSQEFGLSGPKPSSKKTRMSWAEQRVDGLLLGIECSAPMKEDCFGGSHAVDAKSKDTSAFGKRKWRDYRGGDEEMPGNLGGTRVNVTIPKFLYLQAVCEAVEKGGNLDDNVGTASAGIGKTMTMAAGTGSKNTGGVHQAEMTFFQSLLQAPCPEWEGILRSFMVKNHAITPHGFDTATLLKGRSM